MEEVNDSEEDYLPIEELPYAFQTVDYTYINAVRFFPPTEERKAVNSRGLIPSCLYTQIVQGCHDSSHQSSGKYTSKARESIISIHQGDESQKDKIANVRIRSSWSFHPQLIGG